MSLIVGIALIAIATILGVLLRSNDRELATLGRNVVFYLVTVPSMLFGLLIVIMHWLGLA